MSHEAPSPQFNAYEYIPLTSREKNGHVSSYRDAARMMATHDSMIQHTIEDMPKKYPYANTLMGFIVNTVIEDGESDPEIRYRNFWNRVESQTSSDLIDNIKCYIVTKDKFLDHLRNFIFTQPNEFFTCPIFCKSVYLSKSL